MCKCNLKLLGKIHQAVRLYISFIDTHTDRQVALNANFKLILIFYVDEKKLCVVIYCFALPRIRFGVLCVCVWLVLWLLHETVCRLLCDAVCVNMRWNMRWWWDADGILNGPEIFVFHFFISLVFDVETSTAYGKRVKRIFCLYSCMASVVLLSTVQPQCAQSVCKPYCNSFVFVFVDILDFLSFIFCLISHLSSYDAHVVCVCLCLCVYFFLDNNLYGHRWSIEVAKKGGDDALLFRLSKP